MLVSDEQPKNAPSLLDDVPSMLATPFRTTLPAFVFLKALQSITVAPEPFTVTVKAFVLATGTKNFVTSAIPLPIVKSVSDVQPEKMA